MLKISPKIRVLIILITVAAVGGGALVVYAWRKMEARIHTPEFRAEIEQDISTAIGGTLRIGQINGHLGLHPWFSGDDIGLVFQNNTLRVSASRLRFHLKILPLLKEQIVFSHIGVDHPIVIYRRPLSGAPNLMDENSSAPKFNANIFRVESFSIDRGRMTFIDSRNPVFGSVEFEGDASMAKSFLDGTYELRLKGKISAAGAAAPINMTGRVSPKADGPLEWVVRTNLGHPVLSETDTEVPVQFVGVLASSGSLGVKLDWHSNLTSLTANIKSNQWRDLNFTCQLNSSYSNVEELRDVGMLFVSSASAKENKTARSPLWTVRAGWDLKNIDFPRYFVPSLRGEAEFRPDSGSVSSLVAEVLGGTVTASGSWKMEKAPRSPAHVNIRAEGQQLRVEKILAMTVSTVTWTGGLNFNLTLDDFPLMPLNQMGPIEILNSLSKSKTVDLEIRGDASLQEKSPLKSVVGKLGLEPGARVIKGDLDVGWVDGGLSGRASLPRLSPGKDAGPLETSLTIKNMDLTFLPGLAKRLEISMAHVDADLDWRANVLGPDMFRAISPNVEWSVEGRFQKLIWRGIPLDDVSGRVSWDRSTVQLQNIRGSVSSGTFLVDGTLSSPETDGFHRFSASADIANIEVSPFMFAFSTNPILLDGLLSSTAKVSGQMRPFDPESLSGQVVLKGQKGHIRAGSFALTLFSKLNLKSLFESAAVKRQPGLPFDVVTASATIGGGKINFVAPFAMKNPSLELAYTGWVASNAKSAEGVAVVNPMVGTRNLLTVIPGVSTLVMGSEGEFLPLIVDINYQNGELKTNFRSIKTLVGTPLRIIGNVIRLPVTLLNGGKKSPPTQSE